MLSIDFLHVSLEADAGLVRAVDGLSLSIEQRRDISARGWVGLRQEV